MKIPNEKSVAKMRNGAHFCIMKIDLNYFIIK